MAVLLLATLGSCAMDLGTKPAAANSKSVNSEQSSAGDLKLREAWEDKTKGLNKLSHDCPLVKLNALRSLLAQVPQQQIKNEFDRIAQLPSGYWDLSDYEQVFVQALIVKAAHEPCEQRLHPPCLRREPNSSSIRRDNIFVGKNPNRYLRGSALSNCDCVFNAERQRVAEKSNHLSSRNCASLQFLSSLRPATTDSALKRAPAGDVWV